MVVKKGMIKKVSTIQTERYIIDVVTYCPSGVQMVDLKMQDGSICITDLMIMDDKCRICGFILDPQYDTEECFRYIKETINESSKWDAYWKSLNN